MDQREAHRRIPWRLGLAVAWLGTVHLLGTQLVAAVLVVLALAVVWPRWFSDDPADRTSFWSRPQDFWALVAVVVGAATFLWAVLRPGVGSVLDPLLMSAVRSYVTGSVAILGPGSHAAPGKLRVLLALPAIALAAVGLWSLARSPRGRFSGAVLATAMVCSLIVTGAALGDKRHWMLWNWARYHVVILPPLAILVGAGLARVTARRWRVIVAVCLVACWLPGLAANRAFRGAVDVDGYRLAVMRDAGALGLVVIDERAWWRVGAARRMHRLAHASLVVWDLPPGGCDVTWRIGGAPGAG